MEDLDPAALRILASGLDRAAPPLAALAQPFAHFATALEHQDSAGGLAVLSMARALRLMPANPNCPELLDRLEGLDRAPWPAIRTALVALTPDEARKGT